MAGFHFRCFECRKTYAEDEAQLTCPACAEKQEPGGVTRGILEVELDELPRRWPEAALDSAAFLTAFLPLPADWVAGPRNAGPLLPSLPVGATPLLPVPRLRRELGMSDLWVKDDSRNPSGSTKDRASLLVVAKARQYGCDTVAAASTGNAATALAAVSAAAGVRAVVMVPAAAPEAKLIQMLAYGATLLPVDGTYDDAFELCCSACERFGWYNRNTALNPFTIEGKKTAALEIAAQLAAHDGGEPDAVLVPSGDGVILSGVGKGFADLERAGLTQRRPRLIAAQPAGSAALVDALRHDRDSIVPVPGAHSVADSLVVEAPRGALTFLARVRESKGAGVAVADDAIVESIALLARTTGVFAEPAAATALAGLRAALDQGLVDRRERVVLLITGTGLKDVPAAARAVRRPPPIPPTLDAVAAALGE